MPELYRLTDGAVDNGQLTIDNEIDDIVHSLAQRIYDGEKITYDSDLFNATVKPYVDGITKGYGKSLADVDWYTPDFKTLEKLTENVFKFSASKNYNTLRDMTNALIGPDGTIRTFDEFRTVVDHMNAKYNHTWLRTEYNQAVASAQCAARWTDIEKKAEKNPFLQYQAVMDANTRAEHAALHGVIKRYDDEFWDKYYPPNGWGCRCEAIQLPGKNHKETPAADIKYCKVPAAFKVNVGKTGKIFSEEHPYFMQRCKGCNGKPQNLAVHPQCIACLQGMGDCEKYIDNCRDLWFKKQSQKAQTTRESIINSLPRVPHGKSFKYEKIVTVDNNTITIGKRWPGETISKCIAKPNFDITMDVIREYDQWITTGTRDAIPEQGKDHNNVFNVYRTTYKGHNIVYKTIVKSNCEVLYFVRVD